MTKKRPAPPHITKATGKHPRADFRFIGILEEVEDPRGASCNFLHPLTSILFMTTVCSLCGSDDWEAVALQARSMKDWLGKYIDLTNGVPCVKTFKRTFEMLNPSHIESMLRSTMSLLCENMRGDVVSFDGKALRGTASSEKGDRAIHILNAFSHEHKVCIGHMKVDDKSNEITAMPKLMELLDLTGTIITSDALNTQKDIAKKAVELGADYILPVKGNHPTLLEDIKRSFEDAQARGFKGIDADDYETLEKSRGRVELRLYYSLDAQELPNMDKWEGLSSLGMVTRERTIAGKTTSEIEYYICSTQVDARQLEKVVRGHWAIENNLHWELDVTLGEDRARYRERIGAQNLAAIRKITLGVLSQDKTLKCGKKNKRLIAATDAEYRQELLKLVF
jgi:predicted transposase YbfD/YdcC